MRRDELLELHNITHVRNVPSLLSRGILSYRLARKVDHESVADPSIQQRRERRPMPGMLPLHCVYTGIMFDADPTVKTSACNKDSDGDGIQDGAEDANQNGKVDHRAVERLFPAG